MRKEELILKGVGTAMRFGPYRRLIQRVDDATKKEGLSGAMRTLFSAFNVHADARWDGNKNETLRILEDETKPVILVANHPHLIEPAFFITALPPRQNFSIVALSGAEYFFGPAVKQHILPVQHSYPFETQRHKERRKEENKIQLDEAAQRLAQGGQVMIMPDGGDKTGNWRNGSLRLMEEALALPEAYLVMAFIEDAQRWDLQNILLRRASRRKGIQKTVRISEAIPVRGIPIPEEVKDLPTRDTGKYRQMAASLHNFYNDWVALHAREKEAIASIH